MKRGLFVLVMALASVVQGTAQEKRFKKTDVGKPHVHRIEIYDAQGLLIDPRAENPAPYSPRATCKRCHDYDAIAHGNHFHPGDDRASRRPGEPWILSDARSGSQIALQFNGHPAVSNAHGPLLDASEFLRLFGRTRYSPRRAQCTHPHHRSPC